MQTYLLFSFFFKELHPGSASLLADLICILGTQALSNYCCYLKICFIVMQTCFRLQCFRDCVCCVSAPLYVPYGSLWCLHNPTDVESQCEEDKPNRERFLSLVAASVVRICFFCYIIFEILWLPPRVGQPANTASYSSLLSDEDVLPRETCVPQQQKFKCKCDESA